MAEREEGEREMGRDKASALRERRHQRSSNGHASGAVHLQDSFDFRNHLVLVFPMLGINLFEFIKANGHRGFGEGVVRRLTEQVVSTLMHLRALRILHCDLKPENIMLKSQQSLTVRVIDFGSSCEEGHTTYTYIQSRFYRAPEVVLGLPYSYPIDMWSLGCIVAELLTGWPIFAGTDEVDLMLRIQEVLGAVPQDLALQSPKKSRFFNDECTASRSFVSKRGGKRRFPGAKDLRRDCLKNASDYLTDFIQRCLEIDPDLRILPDEALSHPFLLKEENHRLPRVSFTRRSKPKRRSRRAQKAPEKPAGHLPQLRR